jgi:hypothetical protein
MNIPGAFPKAVRRCSPENGQELEQIVSMSTKVTE